MCDFIERGGGIIPNVLCLDKGVLLPGATEELRESSHESFDADARHLDELARHDELPRACAYGDCENHLEGRAEGSEARSEN